MSNWISVNGKMPVMKPRTFRDDYETLKYRQSDRVLVFVQNDESEKIAIGYYEDDGKPGFGGWYLEEWDGFGEVTHWMPLPPAPPAETTKEDT